MSGRPSSPDSTFPGEHAGGFTTTHWTTVLAAGQQGSPQATEAWEKLCRAYWRPVRGCVLGQTRRWGQGHAEQDAEDLTQGFFAELFRRNPLARVKHDGRSFRSFLMKLIQRFLINERERVRAGKRGGGEIPVSLEDAGPLAAGDHGVAKQFDREWAETVLDQAMRRLRGEYVAAGKAGQFDQLHAFLTGSKPARPYPDLARELGMSEAAVKMAVSRLRQRFGEAVREEIRVTVSTPAEVEAEIRYLMEVVSEHG